MKNDSIAEIRQSNQYATEMSLETLIKNHIQKINEMSEEIKKHREMFEDSFNNNPVYQERLEKVKEQGKLKQSLRNEILKQPSVANLNQKLKDMRFDVNELKKTLSGLLLDYRRQTQATQLELFDGQVFEIVEMAKVVRSRKK